LETVPLRELWPNEARNFTTWLADHLQFLAQAIDTDLSLLQREASAGPFSADILAEDGNGNSVVVENQLERTDHDHLGKLITYLSNLDAKTAVWITSEPRPEHEQAVHWLNEVVPKDMAFYLVRIEAYRIGDSPSAPLLTVVAGPSPEGREIGIQKKEVAERHALRRSFWTELLEKANQRTSLHAGRSATTDSWLNAGAGKTGIAFQYRIRMNDSQVGLRIRRDTSEESLSIFSKLYTEKESIEDAFGGPLEWLPMEDAKMCLIQHLIETGGLRDQERWEEIQDDMIDAMVRLEQAL
jgi:hypothetical protein